MTSREKRLARLRSLPTTMAYFEVKAICLDFGWRLRNVEGSHHEWVAENGRLIQIVVHDKRVKRRYLRDMLNAIEEEMIRG
jgi:predicted RNA binding protein YcfA (HicA-like mRNA interferase family)